MTIADAAHYILNNAVLLPQSLEDRAAGAITPLRLAADIYAGVYGDYVTVDLLTPKYYESWTTSITKNDFSRSWLPSKSHSLNRLV